MKGGVERGDRSGKRVQGTKEGGTPEGEISCTDGKEV